MLKIWKNKSVSTLTKLSLIKSLVWSVNCNIRCESWALKKEEERHIQAFENKRIRKLFLNSMDKTDDKWVYKLAIRTTESPKLCYFGRVMRQPGDTIEGSIMTGLVEGFRSIGRPRMCWLHNITTCFMPYETEDSGHYILMHAANRRQAKKAKWHDMIQYLEEFYKVTVEHLLHFREESPCKMHNIPGHAAIYQKMMRYFLTDHLFIIIYKIKHTVIQMILIFW